MWVRMLAHPGGAAITSLEVLPVAVDVQVRKVTEYLGVTATEGLDLEAARPLIQGAWQADVRKAGAVGPPGLDGTAAALDPALWFYGKWGARTASALVVSCRSRRPAIVAAFLRLRRAISRAWCSDYPEATNRALSFLARVRAPASIEKRARPLIPRLKPREVKTLAEALAELASASLQ
jgi:hypothetical protein